MTVYILLHGIEHNGEIIYGVYDTHDKALKALYDVVKNKDVTLIHGELYVFSTYRGERYKSGSYYRIETVDVK